MNQQQDYCGDEQDDDEVLFHWRLLSLREEDSVALVLYGVIPTFLPAHFGRVYAVYSRVFMAMFLPRGWGFDGRTPDRYDIMGAAFVDVGVAVIMFWPRGAGA